MLLLWLRWQSSNLSESRWDQIYCWVQNYHFEEFQNGRPRSADKAHRDSYRRALDPSVEQKMSQVSISKVLSTGMTQFKTFIQSQTPQPVPRQHHSSHQQPSHHSTNNASMHPSQYHQYSNQHQESDRTKCQLQSRKSILLSQTRTHRNLMFQMFPGTHLAKSQPNRQKVHPSTPCLQAFKSKKICIANKFTRKSSINHNRFHDNSRQHEALKDLLFRMKIFRSPISNVTLSLEGDILEKSCLLSTGNQEVSLR